MAIESLRDVARASVSAFSAFTEGTTAPTVKMYGDRWLDTTSGIEYTWISPGTWVDLSVPSAADVAEAVHAASSKATPVDADELGLTDSADTWTLKKLTWANLKATLLAYFNGQFREKLTAARTYYVRTDGSDSNDGLSNTAGGAFLTIQKAIDVASSLDLGIYDVTLSVGAGTFDGVILKSFVGSGRINVVGAGVTSIVQAIATTNGGCCFGSTATTGHDGIYGLNSFKLESLVSGRNGIDPASGFAGQVVFGDIDFGSFPGGSGIRVGRGSLVTNASQNYTISGSANAHIAAYDGGQIRTQNATVTITGTPAITTFAIADRGGTILANANTYSGAATGVRYSANRCGGILTGAGATYLPGNAAGTATSPGWYA